MTAAPIHVRLLYFAWVRELIGVSAEDLDLAEPLPLSALVDHLQARSPGHAQALGDRSRIRAAINQQFATLDAIVQNEDEVAIFPPVTGGN